MEYCHHAHQGFDAAESKIIGGVRFGDKDMSYSLRNSRITAVEDKKLNKTLKRTVIDVVVDSATV